MKWLAKPDALAAIAAERRDGCQVCRFASEQEPIAASAHAIAIVDRYATRPGHVMVLARRHIDHIAALAWDEYAEIQHLVWKLCRAMERALAPRRIYVAALGAAEPIETSFPHVHVHVVPLSDGGEADRPASVFTWSRGVYVFESADEERELRERLRGALAAE